MDLQAFAGTKLTSVTLPKGLTKISGGLFEHSTLKSVAIPSSVKTIQSFAFSDTKMTTVSIPASVTSLDKQAFYKTKLKEVKLAASNKKYAKYKGARYNKAKTELVFYPEGYIPAKTEFASTLKNLDVKALANIKGNELVIPKGLMTIENAKCNQFKKVSVAAGNKAFVAKGNVLYSKDRKRLLLYPIRSTTQNVVLADGLQIINMNVFGYNNNNIVTLTLPKSVRRIESYYSYPTVPGSGFTKLTTIKVKSGNRYFTAKDGILYNKDMSKIYWFPINKKIKSYTVPATVTEIRNGSLAIQNHLENLTISAKCTSIDQQYLGECGAEYRMYLGMQCPKLKGIHFKSTKAGFRSADGVVYSENWKTIWYYSPNRKNKEYKIDSRCQYIGNLINAKYVETLYLPDNFGSDAISYDEVELTGFQNVREFIISDKSERYKTLDGVLYTKGKEVRMLAYPMGRKNASLLLPANLTNKYMVYEIRKPGYINSVSMEAGSENFYIQDNCLYDKDGRIQWDFTEMLG